MIDAGYIGLAGYTIRQTGQLVLRRRFLTDLYARGIPVDCPIEPTSDECKLV